MFRRERMLTEKPDTNEMNLGSNPARTSGKRGFDTMKLNSSAAADGNNKGVLHGNT